MNFTQVGHDDEDEEVLEDQESKPRGWMKAFRWLLGILVVLMLGVLLLPSILSTDAVRSRVLAKANVALAPARVSIARWSMGWWSAPVLKEVRFEDAGKGLVFKSDQIAFDRGLLGLLPIGKLNLGRVTVVAPDLSVDVSARPKTGKEPLVPASGKVPSAFVLPFADMAGTLVIEKGCVTIKGDAAKTFVAQPVEASVAVASYRAPVDLKLEMQVGKGTLSVSGQTISPESLVSGRSDSLPQKFVMKALNLDLTAFAPMILQVTDQVWIEHGVAEGAFTVAMSGFDAVKLDGGLMINDFSVAGRQTAPSPKAEIACMMDLDYSKKALRIKRLEVASPWLRANAKGLLQPSAQQGTMSGALTATAEADLAAVVRDFASVLGLSNTFSMQKGRLIASMDVVANEQAIELDAKLTTADLAMRYGGEAFVVSPAPALSFNVRRPYKGLPEIERLQFTSPFATISASGRVDAAKIKGNLDLTAFSRDFRRILKTLPPMVGLLDLEASSQAVDGRISLTGAVRLKDLVVELKPGQRIVIPQGSLKLSGCVPSGEKGELGQELQDISFAAIVAGGNVTGQCKRLVLAKKDDPSSLPIVRGLTLSSECDLDGIRRLTAGLVPASLQQQLARWEGQWILNATAESAGGVTQIKLNTAGQHLAGTLATGVLKIPDVRLIATLSQRLPQGEIVVESETTASVAWNREGKTLFAEKDARLKADLVCASDFNKIQINAFDLASGLVALQGNASLSELKSRCMVVAKGTSTIDFEAVTYLLDAQGIGELTLTGRKERRFRFSGPVAGGATTLFTEGELELAVFLESLSGFGIRAGASDVTVKLADGRMKVSYTPPLNSGKLSLLPEMRMERNQLMTTFPPKTRLLDNVKLTQEMADRWLVNVNPLLKGSLVQEGAITIDVEQFSHTQGMPLQKGLSMDLDVQLSRMNLTLGPSMRELLSVLKMGSSTYQSDEVAAHLVVREGRVKVDPVKLTIDQQPLTFSGWIGFDRTIDYLVEVPLTARFVGQHTAGGKILQGKIVKIPVTGTIDSPKIDARGLVATLADTAKEVIKEKATERVNIFLEKLQKELKKKQ